MTTVGQKMQRINRQARANGVDPYQTPLNADCLMSDAQLQSSVVNILLVDTDDVPFFIGSL